MFRLSGTNFAVLTFMHHRSRQAKVSAEVSKQAERGIGGSS